MKHNQLKANRTKNVQVEFKLAVYFGSKISNANRWVKSYQFDSHSDESAPKGLGTLMSFAIKFTKRHKLMSGITYANDVRDSYCNNGMECFTHQRRVVFGDGVTVVSKYSEIIRKEIN